MARSILARLRELIEGNEAVRKVANDPALMAELLLLFRVILADGEADPREVQTFRRICADAFDIQGDDLEQVLVHLQDFGYDISVNQAIEVFRELGLDRRISLARHLAEIAKADHELSRHEVRLIARVVDMLGLEPSDVVERPA